MAIARRRFVPKAPVGRALGAGLLLAALLGALWLWRNPPNLRWVFRRPANVLVILIDTLRYDRLHPGADGRTLMPFLSDYATRALEYERAYAASSWTLPSVASLLTGQYPREHGVGRVWFFSKIPDSANTLGSVLLYYGFNSYAFSAHTGVSAQTCGRGFQHFEVVGPHWVAKKDAKLVNEAVAEWMRSLPERSPPWFLYLHYMDMHSRYRPHAGLTEPRDADAGRPDAKLGRIGAGALTDSEEERRAMWNYTPGEVRRMRQLYDGEARYLDQRLAELFAELERGGALANTIVVVTADHGEEFGEHGLFGHGASLYETLVHVPLIIKMPGTAPAVLREPVTTAGVAAAILQRLGLPTPDTFHVPALPLRDGDAGALAYSELPENGHVKLRLHDSAVVGSDVKLLVKPDGEHLFYDLRADPGELAARESVPGRDELLAAQARLRPGGAAEPAATIALDEETIDRLRRLGYGN